MVPTDEMVRKKVTLSVARTYERFHLVFLVTKFCNRSWKIADQTNVKEIDLFF